MYRNVILQDLNLDFLLVVLNRTGIDKVQVCPSLGPLRWMVIALFALASALPLPGTAGQTDLDRIDAIYLLAENNKRAALKEVEALGTTLGPQTPYVVRRKYFMARIELEIEAIRQPGCRRHCRRMQGKHAADQQRRPARAVEAQQQ